MNDGAEHQTLLTKQYTKESEVYRGDGGSSSGDDSCHSNNWWEGSGSDSESSCSSCCSDSRSEDGSAAEWEAEVSVRGDLLFVRSPPPEELARCAQEEEEGGPETAPAEGGEGGATPDGRPGKLSRLLRRRNSKKFRHKASAAPAPRESSEAERGVEAAPAGERELAVAVDPAARHSLGRRAGLAEALLGLVLGPDREVLGFGAGPQGETARQKGVRAGDVLLSVNGQPATQESVEAVLAAISSPCQVQLRFGAAVAQGSESSLQQPRAGTEGRLSARARQLLEVGSGSEPFEAALLFLEPAAGGEGDEEEGSDDCVLFRFPPPPAPCPLLGPHGALLTLQLLLPTLAPSSPDSCTLMLGGRLVHALHRPCGPQLLLLLLPASRWPLPEAQLLAADLALHLEFSYGSMGRALSAPELRPAVLAFLGPLFMRLQAGGTEPRFEELLPAAHWLPLPSAAQLQLHSALSELEANDFEELGKDVGECQRRYSVLGCALFHRGYLLGSHLSAADLPPLQACLRQLGVLPLLRAEPVHRLLLWREVFPPSARARPGPGRCFLLAVARGRDLLAVLLEAAGCTARATGCPGPDPCFLEEAEDTLAHVQALGAPALAARWAAAQPRPQLARPGARSPAPHAPRSTGSGGGSLPRSRRGSAGLSAGSEDSASQAGGGGGSSAQLSVSECSDEPGLGPVMGRRAERELRSGAGSRSSGPPASSLSDSDDSDWEPYQAYSRRGDGADSLMAAADETLPVKLTAGPDNALLHYVQLDAGAGVLLAPAATASQPGSVLRRLLASFRACCPRVRALLQHTVRFKAGQGPEPGRAVSRSLLAVREHGLLLQLPQPPLAFWVVGRVFFEPQPREVYVCYLDSAPQNLVELAFRLGLSTCA